MSFLGAVATPILMVGPGALITFGLPLRELPFWIRLVIGAVLSPLVVAAEFYVLGVCGVGFGATAWMLPIVNLPGLYLIWRDRAAAQRLAGADLRAWALALALPAGLVLWRLHDPAIQAFYAHGWMHTDIIYRLAAGELRPEEPLLAGILLGYPWIGHVFQSVLNTLHDAPPPADYMWTNGYLLLCVFGLTWATVGRMGGSRLAQGAAIVWLAFGVNVLGYAAEQLVPGWSGPPIWSGWRYTPWLRPFYPLNQQVYALALTAALGYLVVRDSPLEQARRWSVLVAMLLAGVGLVYPLLFPAAAALVAARLVAVLTIRWDRVTRRSEVIALGGALVAAGLITYLHVRVVTVDRTAESMMTLESFYWIKVLLAQSLVAYAFFLLGALVVARHLWEHHRRALVTLTLGGLASLLLYTVTHTGTHDEYKFMLTAGICLAPFPALATARLAQRLTRLPVVMLTAGALLLALPAVHKELVNWPYVPADRPPVTLEAFELQLAASHPLEPLTRAIRDGTPSNAVLVAIHDDVHYPTLTSRQLYVPLRNQWYAGVGLRIEDLLIRTRGYDAGLLAERRRQVQVLFDRGSHQTERRRALDRLGVLGRPLAFVLRDGVDVSGADLAEERGRAVYRGAGLTVWLLEPR